MNEVLGYLTEAFAGIQGEGSWAGRRQLFVRLAGCRERCRYCDTARAREPMPTGWRLSLPGRPVRWLANPVSAPALARQAAGWLRACGPFHSLAITGGEPLEQGEFVAALCRALARAGAKLPVLLETNGLHPQALAALRGRIEFIAADIKLASAGGGRTRWRRHAEFLRAARWADGCVKLVVAPGTRTDEVQDAARLARRLVPAWDLILQPASRPGSAAAAGNRLERWLRAALAVNPRARVLPQIHKWFGLA